MFKFILLFLSIGILLLGAFGLDNTNSVYRIIDKNDLSYIEAPLLEHDKIHNRSSRNKFILDYPAHSNEIFYLDRLFFIDYNDRNKFLTDMYYIEPGANIQLLYEPSSMIIYEFTVNGFTYLTYESSISSIQKKNQDNKTLMFGFMCFSLLPLILFFHGF